MKKIVDPRAVNAELHTNNASEGPVHAAVGGVAAPASTYEVLRPVLMKMIGPRRCYPAGKPNSCPFNLEGIAEIERKLGSELFEPLARDLEWPTREQQGVWKCLTCCPRKEKKGWKGLYVHAHGERFGTDIVAELHQLLCQVMEHISANPSS